MLALIVSFAFLSSCTQEENIAPVEDVISEHVLDGFTQLGFDVSDIKTTKGMRFLNPEEEGGYLLEGDIVVPKGHVHDMFSSDKVESDNPKLEQYRTFNLVTRSNSTIRVTGYTGSGFALTSRMRTGLQWAINNYNRINTRFNFVLSFGTDLSADIVVYNNGASGGGGSAGFPSGGNPFKWVQINNGTTSFSTNVNEHVIGHEIGHCMGLRHTDYFNRSLSCGSGGNEGSGGVGAVQIPGTPSGNDVNSLMRACFNSGVDGEFGPFDIVALETLY